MKYKKIGIESERSRPVSYGMNIKKLIATIMALAMLTSPAFAFADTASTTTNAQIQAILAQIANLQAQLKALGTAQLNVVNTVELIRSLRQGMSGDDVKALQAVLAADSSIFPSGSISGFYGNLTAEAVKKFQKKHGFEAVGFVGPKTLKKLNEE